MDDQDEEHDELLKVYAAYSSWKFKDDRPRDDLLNRTCSSNNVTEFVQYESSDTPPFAEMPIRFHDPDQIDSDVVLVVSRDENGVPVVPDFIKKGGMIRAQLKENVFLSIDNYVEGEDYITYKNKELETTSNADEEKQKKVQDEEAIDILFENEKEDRKTFRRVRRLRREILIAACLPNDSDDDVSIDDDSPQYVWEESDGEEIIYISDCDESSTFVETHNSESTNASPKTEECDVDKSNEEVEKNIFLNTRKIEELLTELIHLVASNRDKKHCEKMLLKLFNGCLNFTKRSHYNSNQESCTQSKATSETSLVKEPRKDRLNYEHISENIRVSRNYVIDEDGEFDYIDVQNEDDDSDGLFDPYPFILKAAPKLTKEEVLLLLQDIDPEDFLSVVSDSTMPSESEEEEEEEEEFYRDRIDTPPLLGGIPEEEEHPESQSSNSNTDLYDDIDYAVLDEGTEHRFRTRSRIKNFNDTSGEDLYAESDIEEEVVEYKFVIDEDMIRRNPPIEEALSRNTNKSSEAPKSQSPGSTSMSSTCCCSINSTDSDSSSSSSSASSKNDDELTDFTGSILSNKSKASSEINLASSTLSSDFDSTESDSLISSDELTSTELSFNLNSPEVAESSESESSSSSSIEASSSCSTCSSSEKEASTTEKSASPVHNTPPESGDSVPSQHTHSSVISTQSANPPKSLSPPPPTPPPPPPPESPFRTCISIARRLLPYDVERDATAQSEKLFKIFSVPSIEEMKENGLDNVEVIFREIYLSRADMFRIRRSLIGECLFYGQELLAHRPSVGMRVEDMWYKGQRVKHGLVTPETRVVFRSLSSMVNIYLQISSEMWTTDTEGEILYEKACSAFLRDLFMRWSGDQCSHYVSLIVAMKFFFRDVPDEEIIKRENLKQDYRGRYYLDLYKLLVQNEHYADWSHIIARTRNIFYDFEDKVYEEIRRVLPEINVKDDIFLAPAADCNFLHCLNMSMNIFCRYHNDRRYETTGQQIVYISAGSGIFNIDETLVNPTKQRLIDMGISLDLVCLNNQPLHVTPLFVYHNDMGEIFKYYIPHWMNYSYYRIESTNRKFKCRVSVPYHYRESGLELELFEEEENVEHALNNLESPDDTEECIEIDQDTGAISMDMKKISFDNEVSVIEKLPRQSEFMIRKKSLPGPTMSPIDEKKESTSDDQSDLPQTILSNRLRLNQLSGETAYSGDRAWDTLTDDEADRMDQYDLVILQPLMNNNVDKLRMLEDLLEEKLSPLKHPQFTRIASMTFVSERALSRKDPILGSSLDGSGLVLDNKFKSDRDLAGAVRTRVASASQIKAPATPIAMQSPYRRPIVALEYPKKFLQGSTEQLRDSIVEHMKPFRNDDIVAITANRRRWIHVFPMDERGMSKLAHHFVQGRSIVNIVDTADDLPERNMTEFLSDSPIHRVSSPHIAYGSPSRLSIISQMDDPPMNIGPRSRAWAWGSTGEEKWNPNIEIGTDWNSLSRSALLPITTDFFPDGSILAKHYHIHTHQLLVEEKLVRKFNRYRKPGQTTELSSVIFENLVHQRLQRGFQIVTLKSQLIKSAVDKVAKNNFDRKQNDEEVTLAFGRIYHRLVRNGNDINVTVFTPTTDSNSLFPRRIDALNSETISLSRRIFPDISYKEHETYQYYYQVPDSLHYEKSTTTFKPHNFEKLNWSYLDVNLKYKSNVVMFKDAQKPYSSKFMVTPQPVDPFHLEKIVARQVPGEFYMVKDPDSDEVLHSFTRWILFVNKLRYSKIEDPPESDSEEELYEEIHRRTSDAEDELQKEEEERRRKINRAKAADFEATNDTIVDLEKQNEARNLRIEAERMNEEEKKNDALQEIMLKRKRRRKRKREIARFEKRMLDKKKRKQRSCRLRIFQRGPANFERVYPCGKKKYHLMAILNGFLKNSREAPVELLGEHTKLHGIYFLSYNLIEWLYRNVSFLLDPERAMNFVSKCPFISIVKPPENEYEENDSIGSWEAEPTEIRNGFHLLTIKPQYTFDSDMVTPGRFMKIDYCASCDADDLVCSYDHGTIDLEITGSRDRTSLGEWIRVTYEKAFHPAKAYMLSIKWFLASGVNVGDTVHAWFKKADSHGLNFFPVPEDIFAFPQDANSDPLRCPIRVDIAEGILNDDNVQFLPILMRAFGFIPMHCGVHGDEEKPSALQTVHQCGGMFLLLEGKKDEAPFFYWAWNHMLSHRFRAKNVIMVYETFQDYMLAEFRDVCANKDRRLERFFAIAGESRSTCMSHYNLS